MRRAAAILAIVAIVAVAACAKKKPPVAKPTPPPPVDSSSGARPPEPPTPVTEPQPVPAEPAPMDELASRDLDDINKNSPFQPLFFGYDQAEVSAEGQQVLNANAEIMKKYPTWVITIEGHADERGTAEYNLALGERRARSVMDYLTSRGVPSSRLETRSFGEERPKYENAREETRRLNRRAALVVKVQ